VRRPVQAALRRYNRALFGKEAETVNALEKTEQSGKKARKGGPREGWSQARRAEEAGPTATQSHAHYRHIEGTSESQ
jgi:hypothetical protein